MTAHTISISEALYRQLQRMALAERASIDEVAQRTLSRHVLPLVPVEDDLPLDTRIELKAMVQLSDDALWLLARSRLSEKQRRDLEALNHAGQQRVLTAAERASQQKLLDAHDQVMLRRAHAAMLLQSRGYDMSDPAVLQLS